MMGRVCPAPCQDGCNRNEVEDYVGINAVEQFIGDNALENGLQVPARPRRPARKSPSSAAVRPAWRRPTSCAARATPSPSTKPCRPRRHDALRHSRATGFRATSWTARSSASSTWVTSKVHLKTKVGVRTSPSPTSRTVTTPLLWAIGCWSGRGLPVPGWDDTPNCVSGVAFLKAFNEGRMKVTADKVVCVGGGDTSIDVVSVARRLGHIQQTNPTDRPELVVQDGFVAHDSAITAAARAPRSP